MKNQTNWIKIGKFLKKEIPDKEMKDFLKASKNDDIKEFEEVQKIWDESGNIFNNAEPDKNKMWREIDAKTSDSIIKKINFLPLVRIAASIIIVLTIGSIFYLMNKKGLNGEELLVLKSDDEAKIKIELNDGSVVWLNKHSSIKYLEKFQKDNRVVYLEGEAFFEISKDKKRPFLIYTNKTSVKVLGTTFNVRAYIEEEVVSVSVLTGKVKLAINNIPDKFIELEKGENGTYNQTIDTLFYSKDLLKNDFSWKTGRITFAETGLPEVCATLSKHYFQKIIIADSAIENLTFTASFEDQKLEEILSLMEYALNVKHEYQDNAIMLKANN